MAQALMCGSISKASGIKTAVSCRASAKLVDCGPWVTRVDAQEMDFGGHLRCAIDGSFTNTQALGDFRPGESFCA